MSKTVQSQTKKTQKKLKPPIKEKKFCAYLHRRCTRVRLESYMYCMTHILQDKNAPFQQCAFVHPSNRKRCANAAPKERNNNYESLCPWHVKQTRLLLNSAKLNMQKKKPQPEVNTMLEQLEQYCTHEKHDHSYDPKDEDFDYSKFKPVSTPINDPTDLDIGLDDTPREKPRLCDAYASQSDDLSDADLSEDEEPLKHAGVYTYEEVARIYRDKLIRLQSLYIQQMKFLQFFHAEKHHDYQKALKNEKRTQGSIHSTMPRRTKEEQEQYLDFRATARYHRVFGQESLLQEQSLKRRLQLSGTTVPLSLHSEAASICSYLDEESGACKKETIPLTKYCFDHILNDEKQVLFQRCPGGNGTCKKVIVPYTEDARCILHSCPELPQEIVVKEPSLSPVAGPSGLQNPLDTNPEREQFQAMDDIASLGLDVVGPGSLFGLNQFGELHDESTDSCMSYDSRGGAYFENEVYQNDPLSDGQSSSP